MLSKSPHAESLICWAASTKNRSYSGFYCAPDFGRNAELRILFLCYSNPQYGTGSSFIDFDREQGSNVFVAQRPLTKGDVLSAIGDTDVPGDVRNPAADLCTTPPLGRR